MSAPRRVGFQQRLRTAMDEEGLTVYSLARRLDPVNPDRAERNLYRWLAPTGTTMPSRVSRRALARALGRAPDFFDPKPGIEVMTNVAFLRMLADVAEEGAYRRAYRYYDEVMV